jgi:hypothetical protein
MSRVVASKPCEANPIHKYERAFAVLALVQQVAYSALYCMHLACGTTDEKNATINACVQVHAWCACADVE